jgi:hypothetical protein
MGLVLAEPTRLVPLDGLDIVDEHCLYLCCPYMGELKLCLSVGMASSCKTVKHITPISASLNKPSAAKQIQVACMISDFLILEDETNRLSRNININYHSALHNMAEERRSQMQVVFGVWNHQLCC